MYPIIIIMLKPNIMTYAADIPWPDSIPTGDTSLFIRVLANWVDKNQVVFGVTDSNSNDFGDIIVKFDTTSQAANIHQSTLFEKKIETIALAIITNYWHSKLALEKT